MGVRRCVRDLSMLAEKKYISIPVDTSNIGQRNRELSILLEMSNFLVTEADPEELLSGVLSKILDIFDLEAGRIYLMDEGEKFLQLVAFQGIEVGGLERVSIHGGFTGKSARTRSFIAQHISELEDKRRAGLLKEKGLKYIICVPLITRDRVTGVMNLATGKSIRLDQERIDLLAAIGNQIAVTLNNARLNEELKKQIEILDGKKEMIKFFAYSTSHDLKSPAVGLYGLARRLFEKYSHLLDEKGRMTCEQILKTSKQIVDLVEKINAFIQIKETGLQLEKFPLKEVVETIGQENADTLIERNIQWSAPENLPVIVADKMAVFRALRNLVGNALKYGGNDMRELRLDYRHDDGFHIISVSDDGVGLKDEDKERVFELFMRLETSRGQSGSGLGLAIVKEIAERHEGQAWVETQAERGATFFISISKHLEAAE